MRWDNGIDNNAQRYTEVFHIGTPPFDRAHPLPTTPSRKATENYYQQLWKTVTDATSKVEAAQALGKIVVNISGLEPHWKTRRLRLPRVPTRSTNWESTPAWSMSGL